MLLRQRRQRRRQTTAGSSITLLLFLVASCVVVTVRGEKSAYEILQVPRDASQEDIRRQYRKLCLKYHPDKNVHMTLRDRQKCEEHFKHVQAAHGQIGDPQARRHYDLQRRTTTTTSAQAYYRTYMQHQRQQQHSHYSQTTSTSRTPFYVNGIDISDLFTAFGGRSSYNNNYHPSFFQQQQHKSIYVQQVQVPLQDLYTGKRHVDLVLRDNVWQRWVAAIRGGLAKGIVLHGVLFSLPFVRVVGLSLSAIIMVARCQMLLPPPVMKVDYVVNIQRGWKSGTKLTFTDVEPGVDVVFVIQEEKHSHYKRVGNDLHTAIAIRKRQAKRGCTVEIEPLVVDVGDGDGTTFGATAAPIELHLRPNQITKSGQQVTIRGKGWPLRRGRQQQDGGGYGDLVVTVNIQSNFAAASSRRKRSAST